MDKSPQASPQERASTLQADTVALITQQQTLLGSAWEVLYRLGHLLTKDEYDHRAARLAQFEAHLRLCREQTAHGFAQLKEALTLLPPIVLND